MAENGDASLDNNEKGSTDVLDPDQELLKNVHDVVLKLQNEQKKFNEEVLEKIDKQSEDQQKMMISIDEMQTKTDKLSEEHQEIKISIGSNKLGETDKKSDKEPLEKPIDNKTSSDATPIANPPASGKSLVLKHVFKNILNMKDDEQWQSEKEEYFGVAWKILVSRRKEHLSFFLYCLKQSVNWSIDVSFKLKLVSNDSKTQEMSFDKVFDKGLNWGWDKFIEWDKMKQGFVNNGKLRVEAHVKVNKMNGVYKNNLRNFDESMEKYSDVVLIVNDAMFYVSKLYLATHSPYFDSLFLGQFQESNKSQIKLSGIDSADFQKYLEVLYGEKSIDETTVEGILLISDMYDTPSVIKKCEEFLIGKSGKNLKKKLELSTRYNLKQLEKKCLSNIKSADNIRSVLPSIIQDMDHSITATLLKKLLELQQK